MCNFFQNYIKFSFSSATIPFEDREPFDTVMGTPKSRNPNERARHAAAPSYQQSKKILSFWLKFCFKLKIESNDQKTDTFFLQICLLEMLKR